MWQRLRDRVAEADSAPYALDPAIFADLRLGAAGLADLLENLRVNGHLDGDGNYVGKRALLALDRDGLNLALQFYPHRRAILDAIQADLDAHLVALCTMGPADFADVADATLAARILAELDGTYLADRRVLRRPARVLPRRRRPARALAGPGRGGRGDDLRAHRRR